MGEKTFEETKGNVDVIQVFANVIDSENIRKSIEISGRADKGVSLIEIARRISEMGKVEELHFRDIEMKEIPKDRRLNTMEVGKFEPSDNEREKYKVIESQSRPELPEPGKRRNRLGCFPILLVPLLIGNYWINQMTCIHEHPVETRETIAITLEAERNPGIEYAALNSMAGQEKMTNRFVMGDGKDEYSCQEQANEERVSVAIYDNYEQTTQKIDAALAVIDDPNSTQEEKEEALSVISEQLGTRLYIRDLAESGIEKNVEGFKNAAEAHPDDRTVAEVAIAQEIEADFRENTEADAADKQEVDELSQRIAGGDQFENWQVTENEDGDYVITVEEVKETVETTSHRGVEAFGCKLRAAFGRLADQVSKLAPTQKNWKEETDKKTNTDAARTDASVVETGDDDFELID